MFLWLCLLLFQTPAPPAPAADGIITGRVLDAAGAPVPAAIVALQPATGGRAAIQRVLTDELGRYFFDRLAPGRYSLDATKSGWANGSYGRKRADGPGVPIELTEHERRANTDITMWKYGVLTGMLVDEGGEPLVDVQVRAVRRMLVSGKRQLMFVGTTRTDDRGMYRIANLLPGDYNVFVPATVMSGGATFPPGGAPDAWLRSMTGEGTAPLLFDFDSGVAARNSRAVVTSMLGIRATPSTDASWLVIPSSFAGAPGVAGAAAFTIASGEERAGIDMQLRVTPTVPVSGLLSMPGGSPVNLVLHLMSAGLESFPLFDVATATADGSGAFTFFGVPPGDYVIRVVRVPMAPGMGIAVDEAKIEKYRVA